MSDQSGFWSRLNRGPAVLFLGQDYLRLETGTDPLLTEIEGKFGSSPNRGVPYATLFDGTAKQNGDTALAWISERCRLLSSPAWLRLVADFAWNGVYTSAFDSILLTAFRNNWREVSPIVDEDYFPRNPRNRHELHCTFLFGNINQTEPKERPPMSQLELLTRRPIALGLSRRLPDLVTPLGTLAIEGYRGDQDWLTIADIFPVLQLLGPEQVHLFSANQDLVLNEAISELV